MRTCIRVNFLKKTLMAVRDLLVRPAETQALHLVAL
jgi:hypothetical protein